MMLRSTLPQLPPYDPKSKVRKFRFEEDFENIRINLVGTGALYTDPNFLYYLGDDKEWRRPKEICSRPIFIDGEPQRFDALQGEQGDCWLVGPILALTMNDKLNQHVVPPDQSFDHNYIGAFHFRIWQLGTWYDVVVDDRLPVSKNSQKPCYVHSKGGDIFWAALLEKAYAKVCGTTTVSYDSLTSGNAMTGLQDLSGGIVEKLKIYDLPTGIMVKWFINELFSKKALMVCSCSNKITTDVGIVEKHTYAITKIFKCADDDPDYHGLYLLRLMNPWGFKEWKGDWSDNDYKKWRQIDRQIKEKLKLVNRNDGEFWMSEEDFVKYFTTIFISHLGPGQYLESRHNTVNFRTWRTTVFFGEWIENISAGGADLKYRHINPQYMILLEWPESDVNRDLLCTVVIELTHRSKYGRNIRPYVAFYIYSLKRLKNPPMPLNEEFFKNNSPIDDDPKFHTTGGRAFVTSMNLEPGKYCIVPFTENPNSESQFLLRIFSESRVELWEYDTKIAKSLPKKEQIVNETDERLQGLFNVKAQGQKEIDWIDLKTILESAMNQKLSYFWFITSFLRCIRDFFANKILFLSCNDNENGDVVFSKDECRSMIAMLDDNHSGKLNFSEFSNLWKKISFWTKVYEEHRDETEGLVTVAQLRDALSSIGYNINKRTVHSLSYVYANDQGNVLLKDFIHCGVILETVLALCHKENEEAGNEIIFTLEDWVKKTLML